jgi:hypothetical protein
MRILPGQPDNVLCNVTISRSALFLLQGTCHIIQIRSLNTAYDDLKTRPIRPHQYSQFIQFSTQRSWGRMKSCRQQLPCTRAFLRVVGVATMHGLSAAGNGQSLRQCDGCKCESDWTNPESVRQRRLVLISCDERLITVTAATLHLILVSSAVKQTKCRSKLQAFLCSSPPGHRHHNGRRKK